MKFSLGAKIGLVSSTMGPAMETGEDPAFDAVLSKYLRAAEAGAPPPREQFLRDHPGYASRIQAFFQDLDQNERLTGPLQELSDSSPLSLTRHPFVGYELLQLIARGGMGAVYKARQKSPERILALKCILS